MATDNKYGQGSKIRVGHRQMLESWEGATVYVRVDGQSLEAKIVEVGEADVELLIMGHCQSKKLG